MQNLPSNSSSENSERASPHRIAVALYRSLEAAFTKACAHSYGIGVLFRCVEIQPVITTDNNETSDHTSAMRVRIECKDLIQLSIKLTVTQVDDGTYELSCTVENSRVHWTSYLLPHQGDRTPSQTFYLGQNLSTFLLSEIGGQLGPLPSTS